MEISRNVYLERLIVRKHNGFLRKDNVDIYVTGSNSSLLSTDIMTELSSVWRIFVPV